MYHYTECGLDNIYLVNGFSKKKTPYGKAVSVDDIEGLHRAIGGSLLESPTSITKEEFRFLRKELGLSQKYLGKVLGNEDQTIANWEKGTTPIPKMADLILRKLFDESIIKNNTRLSKLIEFINEHDRKDNSDLTFKEENGWKQQRQAA